MKKIILIVLLFIYQLSAQQILLFSEVVDRTTYSVNLNGSDEYCSVDSPSDMDLGTSDLTILAWAKTTDNTANQRIMNYRGVDGFELYCESSVTIFYVNSDAFGDNTTINSVPDNNEWTLFVGVIDNTNDSVRVHYVVGGVMETTVSPRNLTTIDPSSNLYVGRFSTAAAYFPGQLGEIQFIKGKALTRSEILEQYNRGWAGLSFSDSYSGGTIIAWYKWEGSSDAEFLNDASASNNDLTGNNVTQADDQVIINEGYK